MDKIATDREVLLTISQPTTKEEVERLDLRNRIKEAIKKAWCPGYGLAAIQIDVPVRYAWFNYLGKEYELLNPKIIKTKGEQTIYREGCLSIPNNFINTTRPQWIEYISNGKKHRAKGLKAAIISHETDHMDGILNTERVKK